MTITAETIATALLEEGHSTAALTDHELGEALSTYGVDMPVAVLRDTMHKLEFDNEQLEDGSLAAFLSRFSCSTPDKCREYLRALAASKWNYHLDDEENDIGGEHADNALGLSGRHALCLAHLGYTEMWEVYHPTSHE